MAVRRPPYGDPEDQLGARARRRYCIDGGGFDPSAYGAKVRDLIDEHITSVGIDQKLPPISLTAEGFQEKAAQLPDARTRASEMEHAARHHIEINRGRDPRRYKLLAAGGACDARLRRAP